MFLTTSVPLRCVACNGQTNHKKVNDYKWKVHVGEIVRAYAFCGLTISNDPMEQ